jgi:hypothetical protein
MKSQKNFCNIDVQKRKIIIVNGFDDEAVAPVKKMINYY